MKSIQIGFSCLLFCGGALAGPAQIDFVGLIPGVTTEAEYESSLIKYPGGRKAIEVGSYEILCQPTFDYGNLSELLCLLGVNRASLTKAPEYRDASNTEIFLELSEGYIQKFGKPDKVIETPLRTKLGVDYKKISLIWKDAKGNVFVLHSITSNVDEGMIVLRSAESLAKEGALIEMKKKDRRF